MGNSTPKTTLYRYFDGNGQLLYVGITGDNTKRQSQHRRNSFWFGEIESATFEHFDTRQQALEAETLAIRTERPMHNVQKGFVLEHSPWVHMVYLAGSPDGGHDDAHKEFCHYYQDYFLRADGNVATTDAVIAFAMHFTRVKYPDLPNIKSCKLCKDAISSDWFEQGFKDMKRTKR